jgi:xylulokinase
MALIGLDLGTQSLKAVVLADDLSVLGMGTASYRPSFPQAGWAEQDATDWLKALRPTIAGALGAAGCAPRQIEAVAICGQLDGCVPTGAVHEPLGPALLWMDRRAEPLLATIDAGLVRQRCGLVLDATHMAAKILWLQRNFGPAVWHQPVSFMVAAMTDSQVIARSLASTTMLYDVAAGDWSDELLALFGIDRAQLPAIAADTDIAGTLTNRGAELTGLLAGTPVAVGTGDDFSNLLGAGIATPGTVAVSLGTAEAVGALHGEPLIDASMLLETHAYPGGGYHLGNPGWLSGGAVRWAADLLGVDGDAEFSALAAVAPAGCDGLVFLPALTGAMSPRWIADARGSFVGLTPAHHRAHLARAVLEGCAFAMRDVIDQLAALGVATDRIRVLGGGARSELWCQMRADIARRPVEALASADASALGAGVLAAAALGKFPDIRTASLALNLPLRQFEPGPDANAYDEAYGRYRATFDALAPLWTSRPVSNDR